MKLALFLQDLSITEHRVRALLGEIDSDHEPIWVERVGEQIPREHVEILVTKEHLVDASVIEPWPALKMISLGFTGYDRVDLALCRSKKIAVYYVPGYSTDSVVELAIGLTLSLLRKIPFGDRSTRDGCWDTGGVQPGTELAGRTVGVIGLGTIGMRCAHRFLAIGCRVIAWNRSPRPGLNEFGIDVKESVNDVFREADVVTLHLAKDTETHHFVNAELLGLMKPNAILINIARAELVDSTALVSALRCERIAGAGIDVFDQEPVSAHNGLLELENVVLTPHIGFKTTQALNRLATETIANIGRFFRRDPTNCLTRELIDPLIP